MNNSSKDFLKNSLRNFLRYVQNILKDDTFKSLYSASVNIHIFVSIIAMMLFIKKISYYLKYKNQLEIITSNCTEKDFYPLTNRIEECIRKIKNDKIKQNALDKQIKLYYQNSNYMDYLFFSITVLVFLYLTTKPS